MQSENPLVADFVKLANSAAGTLAGMTREARQGARERMKEALGGLDFVSREEFDAVKDMAARRARTSIASRRTSRFSKPRFPTGSSFSRKALRRQEHSREGGRPTRQARHLTGFRFLQRP